ncbi:MAG: hypothetical protein A3G43_04615 [Ignavibacteria bacterium RIFCSPLOWO2_12_FULL_56_21]|nr:MAG: hypothetical protein A3G43_04615 [Ignavibacteria bacterium RIFCSPLOWO2_12_FULL_56_21]HAV23304.1 hypothetical protein [Bacteroidota bacterium]
MRPTGKKSPADWRNWIVYRQLRPRWWRTVAGPWAASLSDKGFKRLLGLPKGDDEAAQELHERLRLRFFFHPRNRKDFFLNVLTSLQPFDDILEEAEETVQNRFDTLGSGLVDLGQSVDWQKDFKSGTSWPLESSHTLDVLQLGRPSDVKVPWELSRFHQVWWLGKANWVTGNEEYARKFESLVADWIEANPLNRGVNWTIAMEAAIRACNLAAGYFFFCESRSISSSFWIKFFRSLYQHGKFIENNLEYAFVRGNHFLSNVAGLVVLGVLFRDHDFGRRWFQWGVEQLETEMRRQVYADGVNWEKSTTYQRLVLELFVVPTLLAEQNGHTFSTPYHDRLRKMFRFVASYQRPDGTIPLVGDADDGRLFRMRRKDDINDLRHILAVGAVMYEDPELRNVAGGFRQDALWMMGGEGFEKFRLIRKEAVPLTSVAFPEGGFYILRNENTHVFVDAGDIGMDGRGGHGHNDTLSFEFWADGAPLIVDPGTFTYTADVRMRQRMRGTTAHNTIMVDGEELAEFSGLWSISSDPTRPEVLSWRVDNYMTDLVARHHAYDRLHMSVQHRRRFTLLHETGHLVIEDILEGSGEHVGVASLHLAPNVEALKLAERSVVLKRNDARYEVVFSDGIVTMEPDIYSRSYGVKETSQVVRVVIKGTVPLRLTTEIGRA